MTNTNDDALDDLLQRAAAAQADTAPGPWSCVDWKTIEIAQPHFQNGAFAVMDNTCEYHPIADFSCNHTCRDAVEETKGVSPAAGVASRHERR